MSLERDFQSDTAVLVNYDASISLDQAGTSWSATVIDTIGMRNFMIAIGANREIDEDVTVDDPRIIFRDSPDGITYTAVPQGEVLPTRNFDAAGQLIFNPAATTNQWIQTFGLTSVERYVQVGVVATVLKAGLEVNFAVAMQPELKAFTDYDPNFAIDALP